MGAMGSRIARSLRDHGYTMAVYERNPRKAAALLPYGVSVENSVAELAANSDVVLSWLTNDDAVVACISRLTVFSPAQKLGIFSG